MRAKYLGLDLPSPIIVSSSPYTSNVKSVEQCAASGAGAVVLKSIFEEQILHHAAALDAVSDSAYGDAEFSTKQLEKDFGNAAYATIRSFVLKFEKLGLLKSTQYGKRVKYAVRVC